MSTSRNFLSRAITTGTLVGFALILYNVALTAYAILQKYHQTSLALTSNPEQYLIVQPTINRALTVLLALCLLGWLFSRLTGFYTAVMMMCAAALLFIQAFLVPAFEHALDDRAQIALYNDGFAYWKQGDYALADQIFTHLLAVAPKNSFTDDILGWRAGANYWQGKPEEAILAAAQLLTQYPESDVNIITTLRWSIYQLGQKRSLDTAIAFLQATRDRYPTPELSPIWLGIDPETNGAYFDSNSNEYTRCITPETNALLDGPIIPYLYTGGELRRADKIRLESLVKRFPDDIYREYGLFLLHDHQTILQSPLDKTHCQAHFIRANSAYQTGDLTRAAEYYQDFADQSPDPDLSHMVLVYAGELYVKAGKIDRFIDMMSLAADDSTFADSTTREVLNKITGMSSHQLRELLQPDVHPLVRGIIRYTLAEQLIVEDNYQDALQEFSDLCQNSTVKEIYQYCDASILQTQLLLDISRRTDDERLYALGMYFFDTSSALDHDMYSIEAMFALRRYDSAFFQERDHFIKAITLFRAFTEQHPNHPRAWEAWCRIGEAYQELSYTRSFLVSHRLADVDQYRSEAVAAYAQCERQAPNPDAAAEAGIAQAMIYLYNPWDFEHARYYLEAFVRKYPEDNLANNALMWVARTHSSDALRYKPGDPQWRFHLEAAQATYERVLREYPAGHVGDEAAEELDEVLKKLATQPYGVSP